MARSFALFLSCLCLLLPACSKASKDAGTARIAVATNFKPAMTALKARFKTQTGFEIDVVTGSTGALYTQILHGAPFDVFLSADEARPEKLESNGQGVAGTRFTYAIGQLVFWHPDAEIASLEVLQRSESSKVAIANPELAPYGRAAKELLWNFMGGHTRLDDRLVLGENIGQAFAFIKTGNAEFGFVALSQILSLTEDEQGAYWVPPENMYVPIRQDVILLGRGADNKAAAAFLGFLASEEARDIIAAAGYSVP